MVSLEQKLKLTFDPTKIDPVIINSENSKITLTKLRLFDDKFYSLKASMGGDSMWNQTRNSMRDSMMASLWDSMKDSLKDSLMDSMWDSLWDSMYNSLWDSMKDSLTDSIWDSIWDSMHDSMRDSMMASIFVNLSKDEYESLFEDKEILETLPYKKIKELCDLYYWFSKRGLFIHRSMKQGDYLVASWKNPTYVQTLNIFQEVKQ